MRWSGVMSTAKPSPAAQLGDIGVSPMKERPPDQLYYCIQRDGSLSLL